MAKFKFWLAPFIVFVILVLIVSITAVMYHQTEQTHELEKATQISNFISKNMSREISYRLQALKVVSRNIRKAPLKSEFNNLAQYLQMEYSGFFAINYVLPNGKIQLVYPEKDNEAALGRNLLDERSDLRNYLIEAKESRQPRVSHRILTYQKIYAVVLYVPLFDSSDKFFGWLNGVLYLDHCLIDYMKDAQLANVSARVRWQHPAETNTLSHKWDNPEKFQTSDYKIMNQTLSIDIALGRTALDNKRRQLYFMTVFLRISLLLIISFLVIKLTLSRIHLHKTNEQLSFNNNMLSSLSHDIATPLTSLSIAIQLAVKKSEISAITAERANRLIKTIQGMLKSVRMLHSHGLGAQPIAIENVALQKALNDALDIVEQMALAKNIQFEVNTSIDTNLIVRANMHTLVNNVLINVLTNTIKFSNNGGKIKIDATSVDKNVHVAFIDEGSGISADNIEKFRRTVMMTSQNGTNGESGTGLGLLQISGFMKIYGGHVNVENVQPHGTKLTLSFLKA